ncbi:MAG: bifunctional phosphoglucose/phosphomannose isomerase [Candidatus Omnitrophica bacterium]|nr:bifunctional phosphoglucose/phosphomannose isomerase [Candidatus Omnitrophota bacterium]
MDSKKVLESELEIKRLDKEDMLRLILDLDGQCREAKSIGLDFNITSIDPKEVKNIVFTGLGGSAIGADLIRSFTAQDIEIPVSVNRNYTLPNFIDKNTLVIASSYSGNTEETLSAFNIAKDKGARIIAISSNGRLEQLAHDGNIPFIKVPKGYPPRCALAFSFIPVLIVLSRLGFIDAAEVHIEEVISILGDLKKDLGPGVPIEKNISKRIALALYQRFPVIYGANDYIDIAVTRLRGQLAENSKHLSSSHVFPEMNHNEIVGWDFPKEIIHSFVVIFLRDSGDHNRIARRMDITRDILKEKGIDTIEIFSKGKGVLARMMSLVFTGDMISFYLALLNGIDPTPVDRVTFLKNELAKESV